MIEKLSEYKITSRDGSFINVDCNTKIINTLVQKINELCDAVNELQEAFESIHPCLKYKDLNKIQDDPAENVLTKSLRMDKEFAEDECVRLQNELKRTRKALDVAVDALKSAHEYYEYCIQRAKDYDGDDINWYCTAMNMDNDISEALEQINQKENQ